MIEPTRRPQRVPAPLVGIAIVSVPLMSLAILVSASQGGAAQALAWVIIPLFLGVCAFPLIYRRRHRSRVGLGLLFVSGAYAVDFGLRGVYFLLFPDVRTFPNFGSAEDISYLVRGFWWLTAGLLALLFGYFSADALSESHRGRRRASAPRLAVTPKEGVEARRRPRILGWETDRAEDREGEPSRARQIALQASSPLFALGLYGIGALGRAYQLKTGAYLYIYHSSAFDSFSARPSGGAGGLMSLLAELSPIAVALVVAGIAQRRFRRVWIPIALAMVVGEFAYYSLGLYKFGIIGTMIILAVALSSGVTRIPAKVYAAGLFLFILLVIPSINQARGDLLDYNKSSRGFSTAWFDQFQVSIRQPFSGGDSLSRGVIFDPVFERFNGVEAVAVSTKYNPQYGYEKGKTYINLLSLSIPRVLRPWDTSPQYIDWEQRYVGFEARNPTVVPMPTVVEAYLNFGIAGVVIVMFLLGNLYRRFDRLERSASAAPLTAAIFGYIVWRISNVENNLFVFLLPTLKIVAVVMAMAWLYTRLVASGRSRTG